MNFPDSEAPNVMHHGARMLQQRWRYDWTMTCRVLVPQEKRSKGLFGFVTDNESSRNVCGRPLRSAVDHHIHAIACPMLCADALHTMHAAMHHACCAMQAIYQDVPETGEVGAVTRRTRKKEENRLYGQWWGARSTGSCSGVDELTWFIRWGHYSMVCLLVDGVSIGGVASGGARAPPAAAPGWKELTWFIRRANLLDLRQMHQESWSAVAAHRLTGAACGTPTTLARTCSMCRQ